MRLRGIVCDGPPPRVGGDRPQPAADVDDPHPADDPDDRAARPGRASSATGRCRPSSAARSSPSGRNGPASPPSELAGAFAVQQFLAFFLLMPAYIPLSIATFSIIGEKQARTLEPVLATPIRTRRAAGRQGHRRARAGRPRGLGHLRRRSWPLASLVYGPALFGVVTDAELAGRRLPARTGRRACLGRRGRDRQLAGQRSAGGAAGRRRDRRADRRRHAAPGDRRRSSSGPTGYLILADRRVRRQPGRAPGRRHAVRSRGDPDPLAVTTAAYSCQLLARFRGSLRAYSGQRNGPAA